MHKIDMSVVQGASAAQKLKMMPCAVRVVEGGYTSTVILHKTNVTHQELPGGVEWARSHIGGSSSL